jgi:hypothetical protein
MIAGVYNCNPNDLKVSFDTFGIRYAPEILKYYDFYDEIGERDIMPHVDQRFEYQYNEHYQGLYNINDSSTYEDGGLVIYPSTHKLHGMLLKDILGDYKDNNDFIRYNDNFFKLIPVEGIKLNIRKGNYVLWDSRTLHASLNIDPDRNNKIISLNIYDAYKLNRIVTYQCYALKNNIDKYNLEQRYIAYMEGFGTNHMVKRPRFIKSTSFSLYEHDNQIFNSYHDKLI